VAEEFPDGLVDFVAGSQIASYQVAEEIGRGGMAVVYRARDVRLDRWVALKVLAPEFARDDAFRQRFIRESRAAAAVDHPNIIPIIDAGEAEGVLFIAMRYVAGQDVHRLLMQAGPLPAPRAIGLVSQVASALDAAHALGLVHRDVKPANMLLGRRAEDGGTDHVYLSDFGISKQAHATSNLTMTGQVLGTLNYLAPEQIEGRQVDGRADAYSLACAAFEMLAGAPPFRRDQNMAVLWAQLNAPPPLLTSYRRDLPPAVDQVMARALAKSPADRYPTCLAFATALREACGTAPGRPAPTAAQTARVPPAPLVTQPGPAPAQWPPPPQSGPPGVSRGRPPRSPRPARRRHRGLTAVGASVLVLAVAGAAYAAKVHRQRPASQQSAGAAAGVAHSALSPGRTVSAYYAAITARDYPLAWRLGGDHTTISYRLFVAGFRGTERDQVTILKVSGNRVTARLTAVQTDGSVKHFQGSYVVRHGVITGFNVHPAG
jgi:serine/threonine protein kinase